MKGSISPDESTIRIEQSRELQKTCGCLELKLGRYTGGVYICAHYNFAAVFPEFLPFWKDERDPTYYSPAGRTQIMLACKLGCSAPPKLLRLANFVKTEGCKACKGSPNHASETDIIVYERSIASDTYIMSLWSPENTVNPRLVAKFSNFEYKWICEKKHTWEGRPSQIAIGGQCRECLNISQITPWNEVKRQCVEKFGDTYTYDESSYTNSSSPFKATCKKHGEFEIVTLRDFMSKIVGCPSCGRESCRIPWSEILNRCKKKYGDKYEYDESSYIMASENFTIVCKEHGPFERPIYSFVEKDSECPECMGKDNDSIGIRKIKKILTLVDLPYKTEVRFDNLVNPETNCKLPYDLGIIPIMERKTIVEYDGRHHFMAIDFWGGNDAFIEQQKRDLIKDKYAISIGFNLIRIPYWASDDQMLSILSMAFFHINQGSTIYISYEKYSKFVDTRGYINYSWIMPEK